LVYFKKTLVKLMLIYSPFDLHLTILKNAKKNNIFSSWQ
jgi:hypothetical protein